MVKSHTLTLPLFQKKRQTTRHVPLEEALPRRFRGALAASAADVPWDDETVSCGTSASLVVTGALLVVTRSY